MDSELEIEKLKLQLERLKSHVESEGGTQSREWQRIRQDIKDLDKKFTDIFFGDGNGKKGIMIKLDRIDQTSTTLKKILYWVAGTVGGILIYMLINFISTRK